MPSGQLWNYIHASNIWTEQVVSIYLGIHTHTYICKTKKLKAIKFFSLSFYCACVYVCACVCAPVCRHRHRHHDPHVEVSLPHSGVDSFLLPCGQGHWTPLIKLGGECLYPLSLLPALKLTFDQESSVSRQQLIGMVVDGWMYQPHKGDLSAGQLRLTSFMGAKELLLLCPYAITEGQCGQETSIINQRDVARHTFLRALVLAYLSQLCSSTDSTVFIVF